MRGAVDPEAPTLIRVHVQDTLCDLLASKRGDCGWPLDAAMRRIDEEGTGIVVVLRHGESSAQIIKRLDDYHAEDRIERD